MLTEIYCEAFGSKKRVLFSSGLNVIQGSGSSEDGEGANSIGKTNMLKIIDYAFGGKYYAGSNKDVINHVGDHNICFTHKFGSTEYSFRRSAGSANKVFRCKEGGYEPQDEISDREFCKWLVKQYEVEDLELGFRDIVSLYSRIWNKPNKEVNRPLYNHNAQTVSEAIISLIKLFGEYSLIKDSYEQEQYLTERQRIMQKASKYHFFEIPSRKESQQIESEIAYCEERISLIRANLSTLAAENITSQNQRYSELYDRRALLSTQQSRTMRALSRHKKDIQKLSSVTKSVFTPLQEFFPEVNKDRLQEVEEFHNSLNAILLEELKNETTILEERLERINSLIAENEQEIQIATGIPAQTLDALNQLQQIIKQETQLRDRLELYNDKIADTAHKKAASEELIEVTPSITEGIQNRINSMVEKYSAQIKSSNRKAPILQLAFKNYTYGVEDNTGTGKAYTDLLLFDLAVLSLTKLPILIHDSFLFNNIDTSTIKSFIELYSSFSDKQVFIALDQFYGNDDAQIDKLLYQTTRLTLSGRSPLFGIDWRTK